MRGRSVPLLRTNYLCFIGSIVALDQYSSEEQLTHMELGFHETQLCKFTGEELRRKEIDTVHVEKVVSPLKIRHV